jgi:hypothetical protein
MHLVEAEVERPKVGQRVEAIGDLAGDEVLVGSQEVEVSAPKSSGTRRRALLRGQARPAPHLHGAPSEAEGLELAKQANREPKVEKGVVGRAQRGDAHQEGCGRVEGENGWRER